MRSQGPSSRSKLDPVPSQHAEDMDVTIPSARGRLERDGITRSGKFTPEASSPSWSLMDPESYIGKTVDNRYSIEQVIGEGGMGVVYLGRHKLIDKKVAIKILRGDMARDAEMTERFLQEARAASTIGNPHIIDISDFGVLPDGATYFAMEFLDGRSLSAAMQEGRCRSRASSTSPSKSRPGWPPHSANIVHRDMKPDNVLLITRGADRDFVKILDFGSPGRRRGLATDAGGQRFWDTHYMSPEQAWAPRSTRAPTSTRSASFYELLAGGCPSTPTTSWGSPCSTCTRRRPPFARCRPSKTYRRSWTPSC